jgi:hypothetical protein
MSALVSDVIDALLHVCNDSPALVGVAIIDGPRLNSDTASAATDRLFIGATDDGSGIAGEGENLSPEGVAGVINIDTFSIACVAEAWTGDTVPAVRRARVFEIRDAVRNLLRADSTGMTLGLKPLSSAQLGAWQLIQAQTTQGFYAALTFRVECSAKPSTN